MSQQLDFTDTEWASLRAEFCKGFSDEQAEVCRTFCRMRNLIPGKHVVFQLRQSKEWDEVVGAKVAVTKIVFITTIDAARLIALRSGEYNGQEPETYIYLNAEGTDFVESKIPLPVLPLPPKGLTALPREPWAVRTTVYRKNFDHPITSVARFDAYASTYKTQSGPQLTEMWSKRGPEQLAKCSEMLSLRKAFPEELSSLYIDLEFKNEVEEEKTPTPPAMIIQPPGPVVPKVDQTPATPTDAPRPGEKFDKQGPPNVRPAETGQTSGQPTPPETPKPVVPQPDAKAVETAKQAVPDLKPASELPPPAPARRGRKPKSPVNGQTDPSKEVSTKPVDQGISDVDIANAEKPQPSGPDPEENKKAAEEFVASVDPTPTKEERTGYYARVRALEAAGANAQDLKNYILTSANVNDTKLLTVGNWKTALGQLEEAQKAGTLKEVTKNAPLPTF